MACELARHGVTYRIIDAAPGPLEHSKGLLVHARTLELFENLGIARDIVSRGLKVHDANIYAEGKRLLRLNFDDLDSGFPYALSLPQREVVLLLKDLVNRLGGEVEYSTALDRFTQDEDGVTACLRNHHKPEETVRAKWLLACDGVHSIVRNSLGLPFEGEESEQCFLLADMRVRSYLPHDELHTFFAEDGLASLIPLPNGLFRVVVNQTELRPDLRAQAPTLDEMQHLVMERSGREIYLREMRWSSRYYVHHRISPQYQVNRVFLLGDAAHVQNPADGQGLNFGIHDAYNLGWKLGLMERGHAREDILESYHAERHTLAENLLASSDMVMRMATLRHPVAQAVRNRVARFLMHFEVVQNRLARDVAMIGLNYRKSPIVGEHRASLAQTHLKTDEMSERPALRHWRDFALGPQPGDRAPDGRVNLYHGPHGIPLYQVLQGTEHNLLLFDGFARTSDGYANLRAIARGIEEQYRNLIRVHIAVPSERLPLELKWDGSVILDAECQLHYRYGAGSECLYLIRPDGYVGYRCQPASWSRLSAYLEKFFAASLVLA